MIFDENLGMSEIDFVRKRDILIQEANAIVPFIMKHSVGILMPGKQEDGIVSQGSGTCIRIGEHFLVATAAHVLNGFDDDDLWIICRMEPTTERPAILGTGVQGGGGFDPVDVAWIEIDQDTAIKTGKTFLALDKLSAGISHVSDDLTVINGYPGSLTQEKGTMTVSAQSMAFIGGTISPNEWPISSFEHIHCNHEDYFLLASYPDENNYLVSGQPYLLPDPHGMSGGGLWLVPVNADGIWSMQLARLIGINLEWNEKGQWVSANQIQYWLKLVAEDFPDVAGQIQEYLADHN